MDVTGIAMCDRATPDPHKCSLAAFNMPMLSSILDVFADLNFLMVRKWRKAKEWCHRCLRVLARLPLPLRTPGSGRSGKNTARTTTDTTMNLMRMMRSVPLVVLLAWS